ncbi:MAG: excinuclease ABC subunit UvrC [Acidimicrobiaceae bacterium]|nr:excinuclease ABC subunit UvrC [Acidimicrobiaceae bacterium]
MERIIPSQIPDNPGSYQFKDGDGRVIYVGKATSLRNRLSSYFQPVGNLHPRTAAMVTDAKSVEWIVVNNEVEALILEYNLIQRFHPRYNVRLRDDKSYPFLAITTDHRWPRAGIMRGARKRGARYFGPYPHQAAIREVLDLILRTFPVRTCSDSQFSRYERQGRPCLLYHIERCSGPCIGEVTQERYATIVAEMGRFLKGDTKEFVLRLRKEMSAAADQLNFEQAAQIRDRLELIEKAIDKQQMVAGESFHADVFGLYQDEIEAAVQVFFVRKGRVVGRKGFLIDKVEDLDRASLLSQVLEQYYSETPLDIPLEIIVPVMPSDAHVIQQWIKGLRGGPVHVKVAERGEKRALLDTVTNNAALEFKRNRMSRATDHNARAKALRSIAEELDLPAPPLRIECYDMSHFQGSNYVGSMVVMEDAMLKKSDYRRFRVNVGHNDDYAAMYEVLSRRFAHLVQARDTIDEIGAGRKFSYPPSLVVVDGGKGQLRMAENALSDSGYQGQISLISLAKQFEEIYVPGKPDPVRISRGSEALYLLQQLRDEAHRFAITFHRELRDKSMTASVLESVEGMGPARIKRILRQYGSISKLNTAALEDLENLGWLPRAIGRKVFEALHNSAKPAHR